MTATVRPWAEIATDLREHVGGWGELTWEAAVAGDALAAEVARWKAVGDEWLACQSQLDEMKALAAVVAAVHTALDQYEKDHDFNAAAEFTVSAIAKAVGR